MLLRFEISVIDLFLELHDEIGFVWDVVFDVASSTEMFEGVVDS